MPESSLEKADFVFLQLENVNLGNNKFDDIPEVIGYVQSLVSLHLFNNNIHEIKPKAFSEYQYCKIYILLGSFSQGMGEWVNTVVNTLLIVWLFLLSNFQVALIIKEIKYLILRPLCFSILGNLSNLKLLNLNNNHINEIPKEINR